MDWQISDGYDPDADIRGSQKGQFQADLRFGKVGENHASSFLEALKSGWVEVKTDGYDNDNIFIEVAHCPNRVKNEDGTFRWQRSGLLKTKAQFYLYIKQAPDGQMRSGTFFETERLRRFVEVFRQTNGIKILEKSSPGTGFLIGNAAGEIPTLGLRIAHPEIKILRGGPQLDHNP